MAQQLLTLTEIRSLLARQADNDPVETDFLPDSQYTFDRTGLVSLEGGKVCPIAQYIYCKHTVFLITHIITITAFSGYGPASRSTIQSRRIRRHFKCTFYHGFGNGSTRTATTTEQNFTKSSRLVILEPSN